MKRWEDLSTRTFVIGSFIIKIFIMCTMRGFTVRHGKSTERQTHPYFSPNQHNTHLKQKCGKNIAKKQAS